MSLSARKLPNYQLDPPEEKKTVADVWGEIGDIAENISLYVRSGRMTVMTVDSVLYEAEELIDKIKKAKEGA